MKKIKDKFKILSEFLTKEELAILPGHLAYYFLISIVPTILIILYFSLSFSLSSDEIRSFISNAFPENIFNLIKPFINDAPLNISSTITLLTAFFIASNGARSIIVASNTVFHIKPKKQYMKYLKSLVITIIIILLFLFLLVVPIFGEIILNIFNKFGVKNELLFAFNLLYPVVKWPLTFLFIFGLIKIIYIIAPDRLVKGSNVDRGSLFTTCAWIVITFIYSHYITKVTANNLYNVYYGGLATVVMLIFWFYLMAYAFVIGLLLNYNTISKEE